VDERVDECIRASTRWSAEMAALRGVLLSTELTEDWKWRQPCYTHDGHNVVILGELRDSLILGFFKGELLADPAGVLEPNGPNSRSARRMCFRSVEDVERLADTVRAYVAEAIAVEEAGLTVGPAPEQELAEELRVRLDADPDLAAAFWALTPGRRREYNLYVSGAKQASTRAARVERHVERIRSGRGMRDR